MFASISSSSSSITTSTTMKKHIYHVDGNRIKRENGTLSLLSKAYVVIITIISSSLYPIVDAFSSLRTSSFIMTQHNSVNSRDRCHAPQQRHDLLFIPSKKRRQQPSGPPTIVTTRLSTNVLLNNGTDMGLGNTQVIGDDVADMMVFDFNEEDNMNQYLHYKEMNRQSVYLDSMDFDLIDASSVSPPSSLIVVESSDASTTDSSSSSSMRDIWIARVLLLAAAALYGTNFTLVKLLGESVPVGASTSLRFALAAIVTLPWFLAPPPPLSKRLTNDNDNNDDMLWLMGASLAGLETGAWNSIGYISQAIGLETIDAGKSAFICSLAVVFVPLLDYLAGKNIPWPNVVGALMAVAGVALLECGGDIGLTTGDMVSLIQPLAFGIGFWRMEHAMRKYPTEAMRLTAGQLLAVALASIMYSFISYDATATSGVVTLEDVKFFLTTPEILGSLLWTGLVTTALTIYMETVALKTLSAAETTLIFSTEPLWGSAFAGLVMGEKFGGIGAFVGAGLIMGGCVFSNIGEGLMKKLMNGEDPDEGEEKGIHKEIATE